MEGKERVHIALPESPMKEKSPSGIATIWGERAKRDYIL